MTATPAVAQRLHGWWQRRFVQPDAPQVAVEIRPGAIGVVRIARERGSVAVAGAAFMELHPGAVVPGLAPGNVRDPEAVRAALRAALERTGILSGAPVALVVPDPSVRIALVPRAEVPAGTRAETEEVLRFRLRKLLPFDVREARLEFEGGQADGAPIVVVVVQKAVLREYEQVCEAEGLQPGLVVPASLALAQALRVEFATGEHLLVNWDDTAACVVLFREGRPVLVRTFTGAADVNPEAIAREVGNTAVYLTERLGGRGLDSLLVRAATTDPSELLARLRQGSPVEPRLVDAWSGLGGSAGPLHQPLAGAAAALRGSLPR